MAGETAGLAISWQEEPVERRKEWGSRAGELSGSKQAPTRFMNETWQERDRKEVRQIGERKKKREGERSHQISRLAASPRRDCFLASDPFPFDVCVRVCVSFLRRRGQSLSSEEEP